VTTSMPPAVFDSGELAAIEAVPLSDRDIPVSTYDAVIRAARQWPDRQAQAIMPDGSRWAHAVSWSYKDLAGRVTRTANLLADLGVRRTDVVGLVSPNTAELIPALLAAQTAGIAAPVNPALRAQDVIDLLRRARVKVLIAAGPELQPQVWQLARQAAAAIGATALLALRPAQPQGPPPDLEPVPGLLVDHLAVLTGDHPDDRLVGLVPPRSDDVAAIFHTGGTTGMPKLAVHTHSNEMADAWAIDVVSGLGEDATTLAALPLFHVNAVMVTLLSPLLRGRPVLWAGPLGYRDPQLVEAFWRIVERYRVTAMSGVPTVYSTLTAVPVDADISSLATCIVGAAALPRAIAEAWSAHTGRLLLEGYGLTEATCASTVNPVARPKPGSVGRRLPYQQIKAVAVDQTAGTWIDLPPGAVGTIVIAGPTVFPGYLVGWDGDRPVLDGAGRLRDGWLDTGDLGSVDAEGFVTLAGRTKDLIIRGGHNIEPRVVEDALLSHPLVLDASVVGRIDRHAGEVPVAYVVVSEDIDPAELVAWAAARVPEAAAAPKTVTILPALPLTAVGKPFKVPLRCDAARQELAAPLRALGLDLSDDGSWCVEIDGRLTVALTVPDDTLAGRVAELLDSYTIERRIVVTSPAGAAAHAVDPPAGTASPIVQR
jgi:fatty-acyl-CoA synthase